MGVWGRELGPLVPPPMTSGRGRIFAQNFPGPDLRQFRPLVLLLLAFHRDALLEG